jgi:hypothetical protein
MQIHIQTRQGHSITIRFDADEVIVEKEKAHSTLEIPDELNLPEQEASNQRLLDELPPRPEDQYPWYFATRDNSWFRLKETDYRDFVRTYGRDLVERELRVAMSWAASNPTKAKTMRGMTRFLNSWLSRAYANAPTAKPSLTNAPQSTAASW